MDTASWTLLCKTNTEWEARVLCGRLTEECIPSQIVIGGTSVYAFSVGPMASVQVFVTKEHLIIAKEILKEMEVNAARLDKLLDLDNRMN